MNRRMLIRTSGSLAFIVLSTGATATDCESRERDRQDESRSQYSSRVEIRSDDDTCWKVTVDGRDRSGCGDATFYGHKSSKSDHDARVEKVDGDSTVRVSLYVNGKTVAHSSVRSSGQHVHVRQESHKG